jgi:hypothetical protein
MSIMGKNPSCYPCGKTRSVLMITSFFGKRPAEKVENIPSVIKSALAIGLYER